jgi:pimeloyl-ACP methyl ester carboxylesterase
MLFILVCFGMAASMGVIYLVSLACLLELLVAVVYQTEFHWSMVKAYFVLESLFILWSEVRFRIGHSKNGHLPKLGPEHFTAFYEEIDSDDFQPNDFLSGWFHGKGIDQITAEDLEEWVAGMFFNTSAELDATQMEIKNHVFHVLQKKNVKLNHRRPGQMPLPKVLLTTKTPFLLVRPLLFYAGIKMMYFVGLAALKLMEFENCGTGHRGIHAFYKKKTKSGNGKAIVLFHGLGIGLSLYAPFIYQLGQKFPDHDIVLFEMASICMKLDTNYVLPSKYADQVKSMLAKLNIHEAVFIGHSLGSSCVRWIDHFHPEIVAGRIFVDPICFLLWKHDIAYNAVVRWPSTAHEAIIKFIAMCEPGIGVYLHRNFVWFENTYFTKQLPLNSTIYLSELDDIVNVNELEAYLTENTHATRKVRMMHNMRHGQAFFTMHMKQMLRDVEDMVS